MAKGGKNREYHKREMDSLNKKALTIGGIAAVVMLLAVVVSFLTK